MPGRAQVGKEKETTWGHGPHKQCSGFACAGAGCSGGPAAPGYCRHDSSSTTWCKTCNQHLTQKLQSSPSYPQLQVLLGGLALQQQRAARVAEADVALALQACSAARGGGGGAWLLLGAGCCWPDCLPPLPAAAFKSSSALRQRTCAHVARLHQGPRSARVAPLLGAQLPAHRWQLQVLAGHREGGRRGWGAL